MFPDDWFLYLKDAFQKDSFKALKKFVLQERKVYNIYPVQEDMFRAFIETPFDSVKVVILGQDPYHGFGQAHGLSFSVKDEIPFPPSLRNIFTELKNDLGIDFPISGNLTKWANRGVFLLNTALSVRENLPNSHRNQGWEDFTDSVIKVISNNKNNIVFILWGKNAIAREKFIDSSRHFIIKSAHPSPLSAFKGFFGSRPFSKTNQWFESKNILPINWNLNNDNYFNFIES